MALDYNSLLNTAYELEGLLMLQASRGNDSTAAVDDLIIDKIRHLAGSVASTCVEQPAQCTTDTQHQEICQTPADEISDVPQAEAPVNVPLSSQPTCKEEQPDESVKPDEPEKTDEIISGMMTSEATASADAAPELTEADRRAIADSVGFEEKGLAVGPVTEPAREDRPATSQSSAVTLDEKLARDRAKDIYKAFTLNDKFRFRRELFRDSQQEFDEALDIIAQMNTIEEAEEYIYDDLCWDPESEAVKEFMEVVARHF
ncbi:MAG: hypothetical protein K2K92_06405 [Duncaniella sp.]|nr:hypothetical protein [Duncaniella sp.]